LSVLNVGIGFFIALNLLLMHVAGADRPYQDAVATVSLGEHDEGVSLRLELV